MARELARRATPRQVLLRAQPPARALLHRETHRPRRWRSRRQRRSQRQPSRSRPTWPWKRQARRGPPGERSYRRRALRRWRPRLQAMLRRSRRRRSRSPRACARATALRLQALPAWVRRPWGVLQRGVLQRGVAASLRQARLAARWVRRRRPRAMHRRLARCCAGIGYALTACVPVGCAVLVRRPIAGSLSSRAPTPLCCRLRLACCSLSLQPHQSSPGSRQLRKPSANTRSWRPSPRCRPLGDELQDSSLGEHWASFDATARK